MSTYEKAFAEFTEEMNSLGLHYHEEMYHGITKYLEESIHHRDESLVACSDPKELAAIKQNFLIGKLGLEDSPLLDDYMEEVCGLMGKSNRNKHTATFYYLLTARAQKESLFI